MCECKCKTTEPYKLMLDDDVETKRAPEITVENPRWRASVRLSPRIPAGHYVGTGWRLAKSVPEAITIVEELGFPTFVSFDHDLGTDQDGKDFAEYLVELDINSGGMPDDFSWEVHSANFVGRENIDLYLANYCDSKKYQLSTQDTGDDEISEINDQDR